ncbi:SDR family oxidoreductase [Kitasatospora sp. NPDC056181]|uniref:SDR family oxidoreductase n=1 Tax=Kitasatospora sp. NPDC056181 TaxID=3345737 RepID=UPI0035D53FC8
MAGRWRAGFTTAFDLVAALSELLTLGAEETPARLRGHLASPHAFGAVPGFAAYAAAKAALAALTRAAAVEWGPRGVRCNAVAPGSSRSSAAGTSGTDPQTSAALLRAAPRGAARPARPVRQRGRSGARGGLPGR